MKKIDQIQMIEQKSQARILRLNGNPEKTKILIGKIAGENYNWTDEIKEVHAKLLMYFLGIPGELSLNKGVALVGVYGVGKSIIFNIWHEYLRKLHPFNQNLFIISSVEDINSDIAKDGFLDRKYCYNVKFNCNGVTIKDPRHLLINEFGHRYEMKSYGTDINELFESFLMKRYDIFQQNKKVTHITTNYGTNDLKKNFSEKLIDRFKEMFNIIELKGESFRK